MQPTQDSVKVPKKYLYSACQAYVELKFYKKIDGLHQEELHSKDVEIDFLKKSNTKFKQATDTLSIVNKTYAKLDTLSGVEILKYKQAYKEEKRAKIFAGVGGISGIIISGVVCFFIGHYIR